MTNQPLSARGRCPLSRRAFMSTVAGGVAVFAGCLGDDDIETDPIDLDSGQTCEICGMEIAAHYGPAVQAFYDEGPSDGKEPVPFDSVFEFVNYDNDQRARGWERLAAFSTDYSAVDYSLDDRSDGHYISTHATADAMAPVSDLTFVVESEVKGAMGPEAIPFSEEPDAIAFIDEHGGESASLEELR